jgi:glycine hydroxymethyltransferase
MNKPVDKSVGAGKLSLEAYHNGPLAELMQIDSDIYKLIADEYRRLQQSIQLLAAENLCSRAVLAALGSIVQNKTSEGFPMARLHGGSDVVDNIEQLAIKRAKQAFNAKYANVQPHSGTTANQIAITALLEPGDRILSMAINHGGHYSHGSTDSVTAKFFKIENYCVDRDTFLLNYDEIEKQAKQFEPKLIICGASAYPRTIDFARFRQIADEVGALLLADISHLSALVMAGVHPSPIDYAHVTTTSTYKPGGPRGGVILSGKDYNLKIRVGGKDLVLWEQIEKTTFPGVQGTPYFNNIAAKAVFFKEAMSEQYKVRQAKVIENARCLAANLMQKGYNMLTGGTDNHLLVVNVAGVSKGLTGVTAQRCLEQCGIVVDRMLLPYDDKPEMSGLRLGTPIVTKNGMGAAEMEQISELINEVLTNIRAPDKTTASTDPNVAAQILGQTKELATKFPFQ